MTCWAVIPVRAAGDGKRRLADSLDDAQRVALAASMLAHVADVACASTAVARVWLLAPPQHGFAVDLPVIADPGLGLNPALHHALETALASGASRLLVLPADLPQLACQDVDSLALAPPATIAIAPDRHGTGTNALSLPLPAAAAFRFAFGTDSFARHQAEAARLGLAIETVHSLALERDIDAPEDLPFAAGGHCGTGRGLPAMG